MPSSVWYWEPITCSHCGSTVAGSATGLMTYGLSPRFVDVSIQAGDAIEVDAGEFAEAFPPASRRPSGDPVQVLEYWRCPVCGTDQAVALTWQEEGAAGFRLQSARAEPITADLLKGADGVSATLREALDERS